MKKNIPTITLNLKKNIPTITLNFFASIVCAIIAFYFWKWFDKINQIDIIHEAERLRNLSELVIVFPILSYSTYAMFVVFSMLSLSALMVVIWEGYIRLRNKGKNSRS